MADTVENAKHTPDEEQPYAALGVKDEEYAQIKQILGRRPTSCELAMYSVMWSEHCSYKSSKVHLKKFGALSQQTPRGPLLAGIGENAGVVDVGNDYAVTFKVESHNHPSYVEPYQGAATGVGGIVRDILAMGARPVGVMDSLRFGPLSSHDTHRVLPGVVAGVGGYGNCLGLPNIGGEADFDATYAMNPLVNALCVGVLKHEDLHLAHASGVGNKVVLYGAATGGDGIGGASILASETFDEDGPAKRPSVQVGDPFMEKLLIECTLELFQARVIAGIQDLGAAGISCATSELASAGDGGMHVDLDLVPLRDSRLAPEEILMSESQERMCAVVTPENLDKFMEICAKWEVEATVIGEVIEGDRLLIDYHGERVVDVDPKTVAHDGPVYDRPFARPDWMAQVSGQDAGELPRATSGEQLAAQVKSLVGSEHLSDRTWITEQYDCYVRGNTVAARPEPTGVLRIDEEANTGIAMALRANARMAFLNPRVGAQLGLCEAYRMVAMTGAEPVAVTDCLNFGSPEDPGVMWQFVEAIEGLVDACHALGTPVTGGNVSFYNQTGDKAILPTPTIGVMGVIDDVTRTLKSYVQHVGDAVYLLGETREDLSGSVWAQVLHQHLGGRCAAVDFEAEKALAGLVRRAATDGLLSSAASIGAGGFAMALVRATLGRELGVALTLPGGDPTVQLFSETTGRALVSLSGENAEAFEGLCAEAGVPFQRVGEVTGEESLEVNEQFTISLEELATLASQTLPTAIAEG